MQIEQTLLNLESFLSHEGEQPLEIALIRLLLLRELGFPIHLLVCRASRLLESFLHSARVRIERDLGSCSRVINDDCAILERIAPSSLFPGKRDISSVN